MAAVGINAPSFNPSLGSSSVSSLSELFNLSKQGWGPSVKPGAKLSTKAGQFFASDGPGINTPGTATSEETTPSETPYGKLSAALNQLRSAGAYFSGPASTDDPVTGAVGGALTGAGGGALGGLVIGGPVGAIIGGTLGGIGGGTMGGYKSNRAKQQARAEKREAERAAIRARNVERANIKARNLAMLAGLASEYAAMWR